MTTFKTLALTAMAIGAAVSATPAMAVVTTFASFNATAPGAIVFKNNGTGGNNANYTSNGLGGTLYTTSSATNLRPASTTPGSVAVSFSFLALAPLSQVSSVNATFTLLATASQPATRAGNLVDQMIGTGSFSFISTQAYTVNGITYQAGANLLSGTFTDAQLYGPRNSTSATFGGATSSGSSIVYTSDFLDFSNTVNRDFSLSLSAIVSNLANVNQGLDFAGSGTAGTADDRAFRSFRATTTGSFSSDPAPTVNGIVPEPAVWGMMIAGFGLVGFQSRRRRSVKTVTA